MRNSKKIPGLLYSKIKVFLSALFIAMLVTGCGGSSTGAGNGPGNGSGNGNGNGNNQPGQDEILIVGQSFSPSSYEVETGSTITWTNDSSETHTVTSGTSGSHDGIFDSGSIAPGGTYSYTFNEAGSFPYFCIPHPNMTGTITVTD